LLATVSRGASVRILRMPFSPAGAVRNEAVKQVKTEWIAFCDGDDVWCDGKTLCQLTFASEHNCDFVAGDHYLTDEAGRVRAVALAKYLPMTSSWMVRTKIMQQYPFKEEKNFHGIEDHEWWFRTKNAFKRMRCPELLLRYRVRAQSASTTEPSKVRKVRVVAWGSMPLIGSAVLMLTWGLWLLNRRNYYCRLDK